MDFEHRGYQVKWQDWVGSQSDICLRAKWVAKKPDMEAFLYVVVPFGASGVARTSQHQLDISLNQHWSCVPVDIFTSAEVKEQWQETGRMQMLTLIDDFIDRQHEKIPEVERTDPQYQWWRYQQAANQAQNIQQPSISWTTTSGNTNPYQNISSMTNAYNSWLGKKGP